MNKMQEISIEKLCINIGVGEPGEKLKKAKKILELLTKGKPIITKGKKKVPSLGVRPGLQIGVKITIRKNIKALLKRLLEAKENVLTKQSFTSSGVSFGIEEYLHIPGMEYDPALGIMGMDINLVLQRPGKRVSRRKIKRTKVGKKQLIKPEESIKFMEKNYGVKVK